MHEAIAQIMDVIEDEISVSDVEEICREVVVDEVLERARLITEDEIQRIIEPVVRRETIVDPEERIEGDYVDVTDVEYENLPDESKVEGASDGEKKVVVRSKVYTARIRPDMNARVLASKIAGEIRTAFFQVKSYSGIDLDFDSLHREQPDADTGCPHCGSADTTPVWYDAGRMTVHCNSCDADFEASMRGTDKLSLKERTIEDYDIVPEADIFGSVWYDDGGDHDYREPGYPYEIFQDGESVLMGWHSSFEDVMDDFDDFSRKWHEISEGMSIYSSESGRELKVSSFDGSSVFFDGMKASRARIAASAMRGTMRFGSSHLYCDSVKVGDLYRDARGNSMEVYDVSGGSVWYYDTDIANRSAAITVQPMSLPLQSFLKQVDEGGYALR
jgi:hypothetical protein